MVVFLCLGGVGDTLNPGFLQSLQDFTGWRTGNYAPRIAGRSGFLNTSPAIGSIKRRKDKRKEKKEKTKKVKGEKGPKKVKGDKVKKVS